eukprot:2384660-Prymnesium_polylepis.1
MAGDRAARAASAPPEAERAAPAGAGTRIADGGSLRAHPQRSIREDGRARRAGGGVSTHTSRQLKSVNDRRNVYCTLLSKA